MKLTTEQDAIAHAHGHRVRVTAYAGTGKTSSLEAWARAHPRVKTYYVAFNKSVQVEAAGRFPRNVTAKTGHAPAYAAIGRQYREKLVSGVKPWELVQAGLFPGVPHTAQAAWADVVIRTLQQFWASTDTQILPTHIPLTASDWQGPFAWADPLHAVRDAERVWSRMQDPLDAAVGMMHDGYLKLYALSEPRWPYDAILFDEAQDANPVMLQMVLRQTQAQQIFVGDPYQAIYGWRGAIDAMTAITADQDLRLTASFRFGPAIAAVATRLLRWHDRSVIPVQGLASGRGQVYRGMGAAPVTVIGRSNAGLFSQAVALWQASPTIQFDWVGGIDGYRLDLLEDTARLWQQDVVRSPFLRLFPDFDALVEYAETVDDVEWQGRTRLVDRWGKGLPGWIARIRTASQAPGRATVRFSTIHKAKGLEWDHVVLLDDLPTLGDRPHDLSPEDQHLWYVAATRAHQRLGLPEAAADHLIGGGPLVSSQPTAKRGAHHG